MSTKDDRDKERTNTRILLLFFVPSSIAVPYLEVFHVFPGHEFDPVCLLFPSLQIAYVLSRIAGESKQAAS
jgi:hypothetical protein